MTLQAARPLTAEYFALPCPCGHAITFQACNVMVDLKEKTSSLMYAAGIGHLLARRCDCRAESHARHFFFFYLFLII